MQVEPRELEWAGARVQPSQQAGGAAGSKRTNALARSSPCGHPSDWLRADLWARDETHNEIQPLGCRSVAAAAPWCRCKLTDASAFEPLGGGARRRAHRNLVSGELEWCVEHTQPAAPRAQTATLCSQAAVQCTFLGCSPLVPRLQPCVPTPQPCASLRVTARHCASLRVTARFQVRRACRRLLAFGEGRG